jgi:hypothetical protein
MFRSQFGRLVPFALGECPVTSENARRADRLEKPVAFPPARCLLFSQTEKEVILVE